MTKSFFAKVAAVAMIFAASLLGLGNAFAQNRAISGTVVDASGAPIVGAGVVVVGNASIGAVTDENGTFRLNVPAGASINVSCIGYADQTFAIGNQTMFNVVLQEDAEFLEETVVIGYGVQRKSDLTGAVASVREDDLKNRSVTDAAAALQGKVAGVHVLTNGAPGEGASIRVRGYSSNGGSLSPLYIVDGLQVSGIQYLDPSMIESIEILKDAASAAIYGAEAGNGVVLVTTKTGGEGRATVTYSGKATLQNFSKRPVMNREELKQYLSDEYGADWVKQRMDMYDYKHSMYPNGVIDTDWISAYIEPTWSQQHGISFSGGNKNGHFFTSLNYVYDNGVVKGDKDVYNRLTAQVNADYNLFKWLQVGINSSIEKWSTKSVSQRGYGSSFEQMLVMDPMTPVYWTSPDEMSLSFKTVYDALQAGTSDIQYRLFRDENGWYANTKYSDMEGSALAKRDATDSTNGGFNINGTFFANFKPFKGFTFTSRFGYRIAQSNSHSYSSPYWIGDRGSQKTYSISAGANTSFYYQWENFANYNVRIAQKHDLTVMAGMSYRENNSDNVSVSSSGEDVLKSYEENFRYISYLLDDAPKSVSNAPGKSASLAYYGRLIYSFDNRYSFQANFRADAFDSSKLPASNRWGFFPSFSAGWTISNERFIKDNIGQDVLSFLKLRASWGRNGNINVLSGYPYTATISKGSSSYQYDVDNVGSTFGSAPNKLPNPNLKWETSEQLDFGLNARFLNNRLTFDVDYFDKQTKDLLFNVTIPAELGFTSVTTNGGNVLNRGWEFELGWRDRIGELNYSISGNLTLLHNEVLSLAEGSTPSRRTDASSSNYQVETVFDVGYPIWYMNGYIYEGIAPQDIYWDGTDDQGNPVHKLMFEKGAPIIKDVDNDGNIASGDMVFLGQTTPKYMYGLNINVEWKGIDLAVYGSGQGGNVLMPVLHRTGFKNNLKWYLDAYQSGKYPMPDKTVGNYPFWSSSANVFKGDYFRIKQLQLGYTLPSKLTKKIAISNLRFYVSLDDFFTFSDYPGLDPETASMNNSTGAGLDFGSYPTMQKLLLGVNVTF